MYPLETKFAMYCGPNNWNIKASFDNETGFYATFNHVDDRIKSNFTMTLDEIEEFLESFDLAFNPWPFDGLKDKFETVANMSVITRDHVLRAKNAIERHADIIFAEFFESGEILNDLTHDQVPESFDCQAA